MQKTKVVSSVDDVKNQRPAPPSATVATDDDHYEFTLGEINELLRAQKVVLVCGVNIETRKLVSARVGPVIT
jgi:hypothetical protein